jgi:hypothetical protein
MTVTCVQHPAIFKSAAAVAAPAGSDSERSRLNVDSEPEPERAGKQAPAVTVDSESRADSDRDRPLDLRLDSEPGPAAGTLPPHRDWHSGCPGRSSSKFQVSELYRAARPEAHRDCHRGRRAAASDLAGNAVTVGQGRAGGGPGSRSSRPKVISRAGPPRRTEEPVPVPSPPAGSTVL